MHNRSAIIIEGPEHVENRLDGVLHICTAVGYQYFSPLLLPSTVHLLWAAGKCHAGEGGGH